MWIHANDSIIFEQIDERLHASELISNLCGLPTGASPDRCRHTGCSLFDAHRGACGLILWSVAFRLGPDALRWFVSHRVEAPSDEIDEVLATRCASL